MTLSTDLQRLAALSDGIFAVAMTLLAFNVYVPENIGEAGTLTEFATTFRDVCYLTLSFVIAGMFWIRHQRLLAVSERTGRPFLLANILFLLSIVLLPIATRVISIGTRNGGTTHGLTPLLATVYAGTLALISILHFFLCVYGLAGIRAGRRLVNARRNAPLLAEAAFLSILFLLSLAIGLRKPRAAEVLWFTAFGALAVGVLFKRLFPEKSPRTPTLC